MVERHQTVASLVLRHAECTGVLERHRIDVCGGAAVTLEEAARLRGVDVDALLSELTTSIDSQRSGEPAPSSDPRALSTPDLLSHIVGTHHAYLRRTLPFLRTLADKVARVHAERQPALLSLADAVDQLAERLLRHIDVEEEALFPALCEDAPDSLRVARDFRALTEDRWAVAELLGQIRAMSEDFTAPSWACGGYRTLMAELRELEGDVFTHEHLESHVLEPRFPLPSSPPSERLRT